MSLLFVEAVRGHCVTSLPLAKVMPHRVICGAFLIFGTQKAISNYEVVGFTPSFAENWLNRAVANVVTSRLPQLASEPLAHKTFALQPSA